MPTNNLSRWLQTDLDEAERKSCAIELACYKDSGLLDECDQMLERSESYWQPLSVKGDTKRAIWLARAVSPRLHDERVSSSCRAQMLDIASA